MTCAAEPWWIPFFWTLAFMLSGFAIGGSLGRAGSPCWVLLAVAGVCSTVVATIRILIHGLMMMELLK